MIWLQWDKKSLYLPKFTELWQELCWLWEFTLLARNKLVKSASFTDTGRRHETPESETKDFITHIRSNSQSSISIFLCQVPEPEFSQCCEESQVTPVPTVGCITEVKETQLFSNGSTYAYPLLWRETLSLISKAVINKPDLCSMERHHFYLPTSLKRLSRKKAIGAFAGDL